MLSPTARLVPFRHQFHFPGGRWFFTLHGAQTPTSSVPYASPTYYSLARPDQIWTPRRPTPDSKPNSASRHSSTTPPSPQYLIEHLTFPRLRSSRPLARVLRSP